MGKVLIIKGADFSEVAVAQITPSGNKIRINVVATPSGGGTVTGGGLYEEGTSVQITAVANTGYTFVSWSDGNTNATRTVTVGETSVTYTARFSQSISLKDDSEHHHFVTAQATSYTSSDSYCSTDEIEIPEGASFIAHLAMPTTICAVVFLDASHAIMTEGRILGDSQYGTSLGTFNVANTDIPSSAKYIQFFHKVSGGFPASSADVTMSFS